jgi:hypothetical protein
VTLDFSSQNGTVKRVVLVYCFNSQLRIRFFVECHACGALRAGAWSLRRACAPAALRAAAPRPGDALAPRGAGAASSRVSSLPVRAPPGPCPWSLLRPGSLLVARVSCPRLRFEVLVVLRLEILGLATRRNRYSRATK